MTCTRPSVEEALYHTVAGSAADTVAGSVADTVAVADTDTDTVAVTDAGTFPGSTICRAF